MPLLRIETNTEPNEPVERALMAQASRLVADTLGKPERYVMVTLRTGVQMLMGSESDPAAFLELRSIGLPEEQTGALSNAFCALMEDQIGVSKDRVFINFAAIPGGLWGWNGRTF